MAPKQFEKKTKKIEADVEKADKRFKVRRTDHYEKEKFKNL